MTWVIFVLHFFSSLFLHHVASGLLSAIARMELCDIVWPLTYCDELWVYLLRLSISTCDSTTALGEKKEKIKQMMNIQTEMDISTDRRTEKEGQTVRAELVCRRRWVQGLTGQMREQEQNQEKVARGEMRWHWAFPLCLSLPFSTSSSFFSSLSFSFPLIQMAST